MVAVHIIEPTNLHETTRPASMACMRELFITLNVDGEAQDAVPAWDEISLCRGMGESLDVMTIAVSTPIVCDAFS